MFSKRTRVKIGELLIALGGTATGLLMAYGGQFPQWLISLGFLGAMGLIVEGSWRIRRESFTLPQGMALWHKEQSPPNLEEQNESIGFHSQGRIRQ